ncbi:MAG: DNA-processing protein DprA [Clostridium sp.]|nr:DNA-processing protein DprA [Clostridium sp.]
MIIEETEKQITNKMLPYAHWLYSIPGVGSKAVKMLLAHTKTPDKIYDLSMEELAGRLTAHPRGKELAQKIASDKRKRSVEKAYETLMQKQIHFTCIGHADYPERLAHIPDAPYGLYFRGKLPDRTSPGVAIIGARSCSEYGRRMAYRFGEKLASEGVQIISGMARGIDGIGQFGALTAGGYSLGVMGCGVDICYPKENRKLYDMLCESGGVCSEYLPGTLPKSSLFPPRNRIISALSDIVLVVEAKNRSGTLITVDMALEQGKDVYAVPGRINEALSEGCNRLLQQGAQVALSPEEMLHALTGKMENASAAEPLLSGIQADILQNLDDTPQSLEKIKERMLLYSKRDISLTEIMNQLIKLSLDGWVKQIGNSYFMKI